MPELSHFEEESNQEKELMYFEGHIEPKSFVTEKFNDNYTVNKMSLVSQSDAGKIEENELVVGHVVQSHYVEKKVGVE